MTPSACKGLSFLSIAISIVGKRRVDDSFFFIMKITIHKKGILILKWAKPGAPTCGTMDGSDHTLGVSGWVGQYLSFLFP